MAPGCMHPSQNNKVRLKGFTSSSQRIEVAIRFATADYGSQSSEVS